MIMKVNVHYESTVQGFVPRVTVEMSETEAQLLHGFQATHESMAASDAFQDQLQLGLERIELDTAARERGQRVRDGKK